MSAIRLDPIDHPAAWRAGQIGSLLLRLWLQARPPRPVDPGIRLYYGDDGSHVDGHTETAYEPQAAASR